MKIGVIGAGNWGINIIKTLESLGALSCVSDQNLQSIEKIKQLFPSTKYIQDVNNLLNEQLDAVCIATPEETHFSIAKAAILSGKDVFVEKPFTLATKEAKELVALAKEKNKIIMVGHLLIYQPAIQEIKKVLESGILGEIFSINQTRLNFGRACHHANTLWSLGVHDIAVLGYLLEQKPTSVLALGQNAIQKNIEDDVFLHMSYGNIQTHMHCSWLYPIRDRRMIIVGSRAMLEYDEIAQKVILHKKRIENAGELYHINEGEEIIFEGSSQPLTLELSHFIDCIKNRTQPKTSGESAIDVIDILEQASKQLSDN